MSAAQSGADPELQGGESRRDTFVGEPEGERRDTFVPEGEPLREEEAQLQ